MLLYMREIEVSAALACRVMGRAFPVSQMPLAFLSRRIHAVMHACHVTCV